MIPVWPIDVLKPRKLNFNLAPRSLSGAPSVSGAVQVVSSDAGIWKATLENLGVYDIQRVKAWRGIANLLEGRLRPIVVPLTSRYQPIPDAYRPLLAPVPHSDHAFLGDGSGYVSQIIDASLASSVALRAVSASINISHADHLEPGQDFSIGERLYRIRTVTYTSDTTANITFRPPLREAATAGTRLEFDQPVCRMRLATDGEMDLDLDLDRWGFPSVNFVEDV